MCRKWLYNLKVKRQIKNTEMDPKGICLSIYCAKIITGTLKDGEIMYPYEMDLKDMHRQIHSDNPYYDYDERQQIAVDYLSIALNCKNGDFVKKRIEEELDELL